MERTLNNLSTLCLISNFYHLIYDDVGQGAEVSVMLQLPQQNSSGTVEQAGPFSRLILHPDLVSTQRRLQGDFNMKHDYKDR